jgi:hypothetical protein
MTPKVITVAREWSIYMTHELISKARARKQAQQQAEDQRKARDKAFSEALEELEEREYRCSLPGGQDGDDSYLQIKEDREALQELMDSEDGEPQMMGARGVEKGTDQLLAEIRDSLAPSKGE